VWRPAELDPTQEFLNGRVRITRTDGSTILIRGPRLVGDSVVGTWATTAARMAIARSDVKGMDVERISRGRTALVGAGLAVLYIALMIVLSDSQDGYNYPQ
jgi:hypothetical protein